MLDAQVHDNTHMSTLTYGLEMMFLHRPNLLHTEQSVKSNSALVRL